MWDEFYKEDGYRYGTSPNAFLAGVAGEIPKGRVLCLAEGEGRNAVYLAESGYEVLAVDASAVGLEKAMRLARERNVRIETVVADLATFEIEPDSWDGIVSIFCHLPPAVRRTLHRRVAGGLKAGGVFVLEGYTPAQLMLKTGGPPAIELLMSLESLKDELVGLEIVHGAEIERDVTEGAAHTGKGAVVQILARKPGAITRE